MIKSGQGSTIPTNDRITISSVNQTGDRFTSAGSSFCVSLPFNDVNQTIA